jgi:predicted MPP superfamily phosphohydrolase
VSRGTGFWGPPMRLFAPAEITEITLRSTLA